MRSIFLLAIAVGLIVIGVACGGGGSTSSAPATPPPTSTPVPTPAPVPNPSVTITLRSIGITESHEGLLEVLHSEDDISLVVRVVNGDEATSMVIPPEGAGTFSVSVEEPAQLDRVVFRTGEVADTLQFEVVAVEGDDRSWVDAVSAAGSAAGPVGVVVAVGGVVLKALGDEEVVGWYQASWTKVDGWGAGRYIDVGEDDLRLWFDVEVSDHEMTEIVGRRGAVLTSAPATPTTPPIATPTITPEITRLVWLDDTGVQVPEVPEGSRMTLRAVATGMDRGMLPVEIWEVDPLGGDDFITSVDMTFSDGVGTAEWKAIWEEDASFGLLGTPDPEYKFVVLRVDSPELIVHRSTASKPAATAQPAPTVRQLMWLDSTGAQVSEIRKGSRVTLRAVATGLDGRTLEVQIYEIDPGSPDDPVTSVDMMFSNGTGTAVWEAVWMADGLMGMGGDPEYKFVVLGSDSPQLVVSRSTALEPTTVPKVVFSTPTPAPTPIPTVTGEAAVPNPPVTIKLYSVGITKSHDTFAFLYPEDDIRLLVGVASGSSEDMEQMANQGYSIADFSRAFDHREWIDPLPHEDPYQVLVGDPVLFPGGLVLYTTPEAADVVLVRILAIEEDNDDWTDQLGTPDARVSALWFDVDPTTRRELGEQAANFVGSDGQLIGTCGAGFYMMYQDAYPYREECRNGDLLMTLGVETK